MLLNENTTKYKTNNKNKKYKKRLGIFIVTFKTEKVNTCVYKNQKPKKIHKNKNKKQKVTTRNLNNKLASGILSRFKQQPRKNKKKYLTKIKKITKVGLSLI